MRGWVSLLFLFTALLGLAVPAEAEKRVALVVGNSAYRDVSRLANPVNDARLMAETLRGLGFALVGNAAQLDLDKGALDGALQTFSGQIQGADVALFYYAGHGVQVRGTNYLVPVSANPEREADVDFQMVDVALVLRQMESSGTKLNLVILDACRNNPFGGRGLRGTDSGLAQMRAPEGTLISYATQPGNVALDGTSGNSPYTKALAQTLKRPGLDIFRAFNEVGLAVMQATGNSQQPWVSTSPIRGDFYFTAPSASGTPQPPSSVPPPAAASEAERAWADTKGTTSIAVLEAFVARFGDSFYANLARARIDDLKGGAGKPPATARLVNPAQGSWEGAGARVSVNFGGPPYCSYNVAMQNLTVKASIDASGNVMAANLTGTMVETAVGACPYATLGTKEHIYSGSGSAVGNAVTLDFSPLPGNAPRATASFQGQIVDGRLTGMLTLRRIDLGGNLAWVLKSAVK